MRATFVARSGDYAFRPAESSESEVEFGIGPFGIEMFETETIVLVEMEGFSRSRLEMRTNPIGGEMILTNRCVIPSCCFVLFSAVLPQCRFLP
jgi:hypothetical protein